MAAGHLPQLPGLRGLGADERLVVVAADERLDAVERDVVVNLRRRALHEVARRGDQRPAEAAVEAELQTADRVGDDAGAVGRVPDLELELGVERDVAVGRALHPDVAPLAILEPRHVVARAHVDVVVGELVVEHRGDRVGLADLLGLETLALEHVQEVRVAAEVELIGAVEADTAVHEQAGQDAVGDRRADLALDVVADDRQAFLGEPALPVRLTPDEHRDRVDEADAGAQRLLDVPLGRLLGADRQVRHHHVDLALLEDADDVGRRAGRLLDDLREVLPEAVVGHAALDRDAEVRDLLEDVRVVGLLVDRLREVLADLVLVDVERGHELDVADVVAAQVDVHQPRDEVVVVGVLVVVAALDEAARAVADADDRDADLAVAAPAGARPRLRGRRAVARVLAVAGTLVGHVLLHLVSDDVPTAGRASGRVDGGP